MPCLKVSKIVWSVSIICTYIYMHCVHNKSRVSISNEKLRKLLDIRGTIAVLANIRILIGNYADTPRHTFLCND